MLRMLTLTLALLGAVASGGCTLAAIEAMDRVDEAVSKITQSDCELVRLLHGRAPCSELAEQLQPEVYCYRRLGAVDCYAMRDPLDDPIVMPQPSQHAAADRF